MRRKFAAFLLALVLVFSFTATVYGEINGYPLEENRSVVVVLPDDDDDPCVSLFDTP